MKTFAASLLAFVFLFGGAAAQQNITVMINITNAYNDVYVPGVGAAIASSFPEEGNAYFSPVHYYLASYFNNILMGIVAKDGDQLNVSSTGYSHVIQLTQPLARSRAFLVFSSGDWQKIDNRIELVETGEFLMQVSPTFSFGLGGLYPVKLLLAYSDIDLLGDLSLRKGYHKLVVKNEGLSAGRPKIMITMD
jgi:hypothetical protein